MSKTCFWRQPNLRRLQNDRLYKAIFPLVEGNHELDTTTIDKFILETLKSCSNLKDLESGRAIHASSSTSFGHSSIYVTNSLINMYTKCSSMVEARKLFDKMPNHSVVSWNTLMLGYVEEEQGQEALDLFFTMPAPNPQSLMAAFKACTSLAFRESGKALETGRLLHSQAPKDVFEDIKVANTLLVMYTKCGSVLEAYKVFDSMAYKSIVSWTIVILGCAEDGKGEQALQLFKRMKDEGFVPDTRAYIAALKACISLAETETLKLESLKRGIEIHSEIRCDDIDIYVASSLVDLYAKCGCMKDAQEVFNKVKHQDVVLWTSLMVGYVENGCEEIALELFLSMQMRGTVLDSRSFVVALKACSGMALKEEGSWIDGKLVKVVTLEKGRSLDGVRAENLKRDIYVASSLIDMYSRCGSLVEAYRVFSETRDVGDVVLSNSMMLGYVENGEAKQALELFRCMKSRSDARTFVIVLKACATLADKEQGVAIHRQAVEHGHDKDIFVANTLVDMYAKCTSMKEAKEVFEEITQRTVVSWNALMLGYVENGFAEAALELLQYMNGCEPDARTFITVLRACSSLAGKESGLKLNGKLLKIKSLDKTMEIHGLATKSGLDDDLKVANTLVDLYGTCGSMLDARMVFDKMVLHSNVSWNALLHGFARNGEAELALELFYDFCFLPDVPTFTAALEAASLESGKRLHGEVLRQGLESLPVMESSLVDFYARCGYQLRAQQVFDSLISTSEDIATWNALMSGYSREGNSEHVFKLFRTMHDQGLQVNSITFVCLLSACSHMGLTEQGKQWFKAMHTLYGIQPELDHYHCMVDLLGRANRLDEALQLVKSMPYEATALTWTTVLGACRKHNNLAVAKFAFDSLIKIDPSCVSAYSLMGNIYS